VQDGVYDGYLTKRVYISSFFHVRAVATWMNRRSYTYSNRLWGPLGMALGMDFDLRIYGPDGNYVGGSTSWDNPFEVVDFKPARSGYYTFKINRAANRDKKADVKLGLSINTYW
ncbi:MAG: hypothetical protein ACR2PS_07950, partial [Pseudomonadales bacterium]